LTQNRDSALSEAQRQYEINRSQLDNQRTGTLSQLGQQQMQAGTRRDDAIASARRLYNELMQANTQRFGGASSAGQAASELQGREFQRNIGDVKMEYESAVREIDQQRLSVDEQYNLGLQQLEVDKESALNSIRQQFADTISQINAQKGQVESAKASARLDALQELRNRIYQINTEAFNFQQQLNAQRTSAQSTLDQKAQEFETYINQGAGAVSGMDAPTTYNTTYGINNTTGGVNPGMVGQINPEDIYGALGANPNELGINYIPGMN
jgi:hypothetical protein